MLQCVHGICVADVSWIFTMLGVSTCTCGIRLNRCIALTSIAGVADPLNLLILYHLYLVFLYDAHYLN